MPFRKAIGAKQVDMHIDKGIAASTCLGIAKRPTSAVDPVRPLNCQHHPFVYQQGSPLSWVDF